jgi:5-methylcytosine-specific restriction endonuclease McrA
MSKSVDHLIPIVKGGSETDRANVKLAHLYCNKARGAKDIDEVRYTPQSQEW